MSKFRSMAGALEKAVAGDESGPKWAESRRWAGCRQFVPGDPVQFPV